MRVPNPRSPRAGRSGGRASRRRAGRGAPPSCSGTTRLEVKRRWPCRSEASPLLLSRARNCGPHALHCTRHAANDCVLSASSLTPSCTPPGAYEGPEARSGSSQARYRLRYRYTRSKRLCRRPTSLAETQVGNKRRLKSYEVHPSPGGDRLHAKSGSPRLPSEGGEACLLIGASSGSGRSIRINTSERRTKC